MAKAPRDCPCCSGERYQACCAPIHSGALEAPTPARLMRSRFAAFALGLGEYLERTLASDHADRDLPREALVRELSRTRERLRFLGLRVLHEESSGDDGEVLFFARVFERGADCSFAELSRFALERGAWRYASGVVVPKADLPVGIDELTPAAVRAWRPRE